MRSYALLVFLFLFSGAAFLDAQSEDPLLRSYRYYVTANWDSLYSQQKALQRQMQGQQSYYLSYRLGEAAWHKGDFRKAAFYFQKASRLNSTDTLSLQYLQRSLLYAGLSDEALAVLPQLKKNRSHSTYPAKASHQHQLFTELGVRQSTKDSVGALYYGFLNANFTVHPKWHLGVAYTMLQQGWYFGEVVQSNYLGRLKFMGSPHWQGEVYGAYLDLRIDFSSGITQFDQFMYSGAQFRFQQTAWSADLGYCYSNFNLRNQHLAQLGFRWFPTLRRTWSLHGATWAQWLDGNTATAFRLGLSKGLGKRFWLNADALWGNIAFLVEDAGFLPNNSPDLCQWRVRSTIGFFPAKRWEFYLTASAEQRKESFRGFTYQLWSVFPGVKFYPFRK